MKRKSKYKIFKGFDSKAKAEKYFDSLCVLYGQGVNGDAISLKQGSGQIEIKQDIMLGNS